jgi:hypothetical protein
VQKNRKQDGVIITKLISYKGGALKLTADVENGGSIAVTILNSDGGQIATSKYITKTITDEILQFNSEINEEKISLKIEIIKAKVYSFCID